MVKRKSQISSKTGGLRGVGGRWGGIGRDWMVEGEGSRKKDSTLSGCLFFFGSCHDNTSFILHSSFLIIGRQ